ncbi:MAG: serine/threonine-protein kinase PknK, partial [Deltaproteobacteria bacterium]
IMMRTVLDDPPPLAEVLDEPPAVLEALVGRMLAKDRAHRPKDGDEVAQLLEELLASEELSDSVASRRPGLTNAERRVTCLVVGRFDSGHESGDDAAREVLLRLPALQPVLARMRASFDVLTGGTLVVSFGDACGSVSDLATRGARCALALSTSFADLRLVVVTGSAIDTGRTLTGGTIDRAANMLTHPSLPFQRGIVLDRATAVLLESRFVVEPIERGALLKGERESEGLRTLLGQPSLFVGRDRELAFARNWFDQDESNPRARAVLLTAPPGLGKSRLRHELLSQLMAKRPDVVLWSTRGDPLSAASPFGLVGSLIRRLAGMLESEPAAERRDRLHQRVAQNVDPASVDRVTDFLGEVVALPNDHSAEVAAARRDATLMGDQIRRAFADLVVAECSQAFLVILVEDLQWGDLPSIKLLDAALHTARTRPLLVLALGRPDVHELFPRLWQEHGLQELELEPLDQAASTQLVREALGPQLSQEIVEQIVRRAEGNAFFLEELVRAVSRGQVDALPATVLATVQARLDALPAEPRRVLRGASVFGQRFTRAGVMSLLGQDTTFDVEQCLADLVHQEILAPTRGMHLAAEQAYVFRQAIMQEAAYAMLTDEDRQLAHRLAAEWLEAAGESDPVVLAEHFERGQLALRAVPWWTQAAQHALDGNDLDQVIDQVARAVACGAQGEALGQLGVIAAEAYLWRGETHVAEPEARQALELLPRGSPGYCKAAALGATAAGRQGHQAARTELVAQILSLDPAGDVEPDRIVSMAHCSIQQVFAGDLTGADELLRRIEHAGPAAREDDAAAAMVLRAQAWRAIVAGDPGAYGSLMQAAAKRFTGAGDVRNACMQRVNMAYAAASVGQYEAAVEDYQEVIASSIPLGLANATAVARHNLGFALAMLGQLDAAEREETLALEAFELQSDRRLQGMSFAYLAIIAMENHDLGRAEQAVRCCLALLQAEAPPRAMALGLFSRVLVAAARIEEGLECARKAQALLDALGGVDEGEGLIRLAYAETLAAAGLGTEARDAIAQARQRLQERAARITPPSWQQSFLERVPEHARTLLLAAEWLPGAEPLA